MIHRELNEGQVPIPRKNSNTNFFQEGNSNHFHSPCIERPEFLFHHKGSSGADLFKKEFSYGQPDYMGWNFLLFYSSIGSAKMGSSGKSFKFLDHPHGQSPFTKIFSGNNRSNIMPQFNIIRFGREFKFWKNWG